MAGVAATVPDPRVPRLPGIFTLLEDGDNTNPQSRLERLVTLPLGDSPPLVVCLETPKPHIRVLWGAQFVTQYFSEPTLEDRKVLAFAKGHPPRPPNSYSGGATRVAHPSRHDSTQSGVDGGFVGAPRPRTSSLTPGHPKNREGSRTPGVP